MNIARCRNGLFLITHPRLRYSLTPSYGAVVFLKLLFPVSYGYEAQPHDFTTTD